MFWLIILNVFYLVSTSPLFTILALALLVSWCLASPFPSFLFLLSVCDTFPAHPAAGRIFRLWRILTTVFVKVAFAFEASQNIVIFKAAITNITIWRWRGRYGFHIFVIFFWLIFVIICAFLCRIFLLLCFFFGCINQWQANTTIPVSFRNVLYKKYTQKS